MSCELRIGDYNYVFDESVDLVPSTEDASFPATNLRHYHRSKVWRTTSTLAQSLVIDLRTAEEIDTFVMVFDPESSPTFSAGTTFSLQASATNSWSSPTVNVTPTFDENFGVLSYFFAASQEYRYWRLYIDDPSSALGYFETHKIFLGKATQLTQLPSIGIRLSEQDQSTVDSNDYGHEYSDTYPKRRSWEFSYRLLTETDKGTLRDIYHRCGKTKPIFFCLDATQEFFQDKDELILYSYLDNDYEASQIAFTYFDTTIQLREAI